MQFRAMHRSFFFCYHKVGSALCAKLAEKLAATFGWEAAAWAGQIKWIDPSKQITTFAHSLIEFDLSATPHKGVRLLRDPRDILVSGYLYHQRCRERWCINDHFDLTPPILPPRVPHSQAHRSEEWKRAYLINLGGLSYQQNLLTRDREEGLNFEMDRYTRWTIEAMLSWKPDPDTIDVKIEHFIANFDGTLELIFRHFGLPESDIPKALAAVRDEDLARMSDEQIAENPHIHSRSISKWKTMLTPQQIQQFDEKYAGAIAHLGYPASQSVLASS